MSALQRRNVLGLLRVMFTEGSPDYLVDTLEELAYLLGKVNGGEIRN